MMRTIDRWTLRYLLTALMALLGVGALRAQYRDLPTDDLVAADDNAAIEPGNPEGAVVAVCLKGASDTAIYTAFGMDVILPKGFEVKDVTLNGAQGTSASTLYPSQEKKHKLEWNILEDGRVRVACMSLNNQNLLSVEGALYHLWLKPLPPYEQPRVEQIALDSIQLVKADAQGYIPQSNPSDFEIRPEVYIPIQVSAEYHWSTCLLPFDAEVPEGVIAYEAKEADYEDCCLYLSPAENIQAFTPYILYSEKGYSQTLHGTVDAEKYDGQSRQSGYLVGVHRDTRISEGYVLQAQKGNVEFYRVDKMHEAVVPAGKAYLLLDSDSPKQMSLIRQDAEAAGIEHVRTDAKTMYYDLMGRSVKEPNVGQIVIKKERSNRI